MSFAYERKNTLAPKVRRNCYNATDLKSCFNCYIIDILVTTFRKLLKNNSSISQFLITKL